MVISPTSALPIDILMLCFLYVSVFGCLCRSRKKPKTLGGSKAKTGGGQRQKPWGVKPCFWPDMAMVHYVAMGLGRAMSKAVGGFLPFFSAQMCRTAWASTSEISGSPDNFVRAKMIALSSKRPHQCLAVSGVAGGVSSSLTVAKMAVDISISAVVIRIFR